VALSAIVLSDLHLGAPASVLNDGRVPFEPPGAQDGAGRRVVRHGDAAREALAATLANAAAGRPVERLVLLGDLVDLSHAAFPTAIEQLRSFLEVVRAALPELGAVVWVPGNHDRHWWALQTTHDAVAAPLLDGRLPAAAEAVRRTTPPEGRRDPPLVRAPIAEALGPAPLVVAYPDYTFRAGDRVVRCAHGHLLDDLYTLLGHLLEGAAADLADRARRRDPAPAPTRTQARVLDAARDAFADAVRATLEAEPGKRLDPELVERLNAPLVDLDWLLFGQTGLLRDGRIARALLGMLARVEAGLEDETRARDALRGLGQVLALALLDRIAEPPRGRTLHSYSNDPVKTGLVDPLLDRLLGALLRKRAGRARIRRRTGPPDDPPGSWSRGRSVQAMLPAVRRYLDRTGDPPPDAFIFGHTHVPGRARLDGTEVWNTGGWVASLRCPEPAADAAVVDAGVVRFVPQEGA
jgi:hypothetical protein